MQVGDAHAPILGLQMSFQVQVVSCTSDQLAKNQIPVTRSLSSVNLKYETFYIGDHFHYKRIITQEQPGGGDAWGMVWEKSWSLPALSRSPLFPNLHVFPNLEAP